MANTTHDVILRFVSDQASQQKAVGDVNALNKKIEETGKQASQISKGVNEWSKSLEEAERLSKKFGDEFVKRYEAAIKAGKSLEEAIAGVRSELEKVSESASDAAQEVTQAAQAQRLTWTQFVKQNMGPEMKAAMQQGLGHAEAHKVAITKIAEAWKQYKAEGVTALKTVASEEDKTAQAAQNVMAQAQAEAKLLRTQAAEISSDLEASRIAALRSVAGQLQGLGQSALLTGGAITGGIFLAAKNYIKDADEADRLTQRWAASTTKIEAAQTRIGRVAAQEVLPWLEKAADIADQVASFTQSHPEIVQAALNVGLFTTGFGALAVAVSKGIKLVADVKYLATLPVQLEAARLQDQAASKQLLAAQQRLKDLGVPDGKTPAGGGGIGGIAGIVAAILAGGSFYSALGRGAANFGARQFGFESPEAFWKEMLEKLGLVKESADEAAGSLEGAAKGVSSVASLGSDLATSSNRDQIVAAWEQWQQEDARIVQEAAQRRLEIVRDAEARIADATRQYANQVTSINANAARRAQEITEDFLRSQAEAEAAYQEQRAQIIRDAAEQIRDIEEAHQERVRKMTEEHNDRVADLTASRDALGLVKEQRRFEQEKDEEDRNTRREIAKRRQDLAERLAELDRQHQAEKAQRLAAFQEALAENEEQRQEQLRQAAEAFAEEQRQIREQRDQQLRDLQESMNAERLRRREVFLEQIRDLDASLLGERNLRIQRYSEMLADAEAFLAAYRAALPTATTAIPPLQSHDYTGYAYSGIHRMAANGQPEYVLSGAATRAAEQLIGGRLTQDAVLTALARGTGNSRSLTINDQSRFDGRISASQVRAIKRETRDGIIREMFGD